MTDETVITPAVESKATPEIQQKAESMGWIPPARFKKDPEQFIDAEEYLRRGEQVIPIIKQHSKELEGKVAALQGELAKRDRLIAESREAIFAIEERYTVETQKKVEAARREILDQLKQAKRDQDVDAEVELTDQLTRLDVAKAEAKKEAAPTPPAPFVPPPELVEWSKSNPWFGKDKKRTAVALAAAEELREANDPAQGAEFFAKVSAAVAEVFPGEKAVDKVEGGARSGGSSGSGNGQSFSDLPADAKAACNADAKNFVGKGKRYESVAQWQKRYAEIYFGASS